MNAKAIPTDSISKSCRFVVFSQIGNESLLLYNSFLQSGRIVQKSETQSEEK